MDDWLDRAEAGTMQLIGSYHHTFEERGVVRLRQGRLFEAVENLAVALHYAPSSSQCDAKIARTLIKAVKLWEKKSQLQAARKGVKSV